ncbi:MAG: hypothetical protein K2H17_10795 [Duncaniella sp.]|uniref:clostripain-related cysteine peptidase n=1 Tax=Duncaniella sp. TaxID=2518496 RepID=UPI0023CF79EB|nr:clostripain-related cysteine peptidase [Duncaniella sp.]MDE5989868.1 hypothetical protein [Duncaniella sp.]
MHRFLLSLLLILCSLFILSSCGTSADEPPAPNPPDPPEPPVMTTRRTVLVYMLADNNLGTYNSFDRNDLAEMKQGVRDGALNGGRLIVYYNRPYTAQGNPPQLIEITPEGETVLKTYPDDPDLYSVEIGRMRQVLADMKTLAPAEDYGMVFWGHATAWMTHPEDMDASMVSRSYGTDRDRWMSLSSLGKALEGEKFSFIYFDCCLMGTVEIAYELRDVTPVITGSPTEVEGEGMPYHLNLPAFFASDAPDMVRAAENTYTYLSGKGLRSQMVVVDTSGLDDLAQASRDIFATLTSYPEDLGLVQCLSQRFNPLDPVYSNTRPVYDMEDYMQLLGRQQPQLLAAWQEAFDKCILYKATTSRDFTGIAIRTYGGLGSFIIKKAEETSYRGYDKTLWWLDVVSAAPLFN